MLNSLEIYKLTLLAIVQPVKNSFDATKLAANDCSEPKADPIQQFARRLWFAVLANWHSENGATPIIIGVSINLTDNRAQNFPNVAVICAAAAPDHPEVG